MMLIRELARLLREIRKGMRAQRKRDEFARAQEQNVPTGQPRRVAKTVSSDDAAMPPKDSEDGDELPDNFQRILAESERVANEFGDIAKLYEPPAAAAQTPPV